MKIVKKFIIILVVAVIFASSLLNFYKDRTNILKKLGIVKKKEEPGYSVSNQDIYWANEIMKGGYILHFRHAERDKWIDVQMYDALESDLHDKGINQSRLAENEYFSEAVCLNKRGKIQAKAMGEHLKNINFPVGFIISSPICRSRQTVEIAFGRYDQLDRDLVHRGPYNQTKEDHIKDLIALYKSLPIEKSKNTIVSGHNGTLSPEMFENDINEVNLIYKGKITLEEGGFVVISRKENKLYLEHSFNNFLYFIKIFYPR